MSEPWNWNIENLQSLTGQAESLRLDFKQSKLLLESRERIAENLSREVSAFANTEGGVIVIGIKEKKEGRAKIAEGLDEGTDSNSWSPEMLQQVLESNVSPYLTGLRVRPIFIDNERRKYAFVIYVPQGTTAYQASDHRYYGRSEYEARSLPDHEIRLRMSRGKAPRAAVHVLKWSERDIHVTPQNAKSNIGDQANNFADELNKLDPNANYPLKEYRFNLVVANTGEVNITEFKVRAKFLPEDYFALTPIDQSYKDGWARLRYGPWQSSRDDPPMRVNIYPGDEFEISQEVIYLRPGETLREKGLVMNWRLYLKDTFAIKDQIDIAEEFERWKMLNQAQTSVTM